MEIVNLPFDADGLRILGQNNFENIIFCCSTTKCLSDLKQKDKQIFSEIMNSKNIVQITGGYNGGFSKYFRIHPDERFFEGNESTTYRIKYGRTLYNTEDVCKILDIYEKIESGIKENWTDIQKAMYVYAELQKYILSYNTKGGNYRDNGNGSINSNNDSLLALVDESGICDSISCVFHEAMQRIGVESSQVLAEEHAFNIISVKDENGNKTHIAVDLTWDIHLNEKSDKAKTHFKYFGFPIDFNGDPAHIPTGIDDVMKGRQCRTLTPDSKKQIWESLTTKQSQFEK